MGTCSNCCKARLRFGHAVVAILPQEQEKVDLREYHYDLIKFRGLSEHHHELMCKHFQEVLEELGNVLPAETKTSAMAAMRATRTHYRPMKPGE
jgi:hypothetical protein